MKMTQLFTKTAKSIPSDEVSKNAQLLIRAGFVDKEMAGVYSYLPLGVRVLEKIKKIIREEMNSIDGQEVIMTSLQNKSTWEKTSRWDDDVVDIWFKTRLKDDTEIGLAWSHEEPIMAMMEQHVSSYRDLPASVYQFQTKLRNELRAKSGIMRGREFVMKDMYSLHETAEDLDLYYEKVKQAYLRIYERLGIGDDTFVTFASGGAFTKFSHEFQTICDAGEDVLYVNKEKGIAVNEEVLDDAIKEFGIAREDLNKVKSAEVGNIFNFGTEKSEQMNIGFTDRAGVKRSLYLASYGIGVTRVMGVIVEKSSDDRGIIWPESIAPFKVIICRIGAKDEVVGVADSLYEKLQSQNIEVLYDNRDIRPGQMLADADLIGIPHRIVVSDKTLAIGKYEYKSRGGDSSSMLSIDDILGVLIGP